MRVFVTGAASPLGRTLIDRLVLRGDEVTGQVRRRSGVTILERLRAHPFRSDLGSGRQLTEAMRGCDVVFHLARYFDFWSPDDTYERVNAAGTRNVLGAAQAAGVKRVVVCSSAITIGEPQGQEGSEFTRHRGQTYTALERSLLKAEQFALSARTPQMQVVIVNPGLILAAGDSGWTGRLLARYIAGRSWFAFDAPMGWVSVHDVAKAMLLAAERGEDGSRYILSGATLSQRALLTIVAQMSDRMPPLALPSALGQLSAAVAQTVTRGSRPRLSLDEVRFGRVGFRVDGSHARQTLEFDYTPMGRYLPGVVESYRSALSRFQD